ncbi:hypothetical protein PNOK_0029400 [Pyrrhoderma noxium]|uniref:Uncharacterized protein n=1 Tax=Pyrrhoderma noxium TaxID=2282107 RepID=A0A286UUE9_9AGAM|nr:hypothetical protein PNOK_0029400 [Pyrrhoderma noxium]
MPPQHGDDLQDDFLPDPLVADSGGEDQSDLDDSPASHLSGPQPSLGDVAKARKRKRREKEKERKKKRLVVSSDEVYSKEPISIATLSPAQIAEYLHNLQALSFPKLSAMELDDLRIPSSAILDTSEWVGARSLDQLTDFITEMTPTLKARLRMASKNFGSPTSKFLRQEKGGDAAKLFARHFKLEEHMAYLKRAKIGSAVGTPGRIGKLLCESDALSVSALTHIIFDATYRDVKKRSLFDITETRDEVFRLVLGADSVRKAIKQGKVQLVFF